MYTINDNKGRTLTRATAQEALNAFKELYKPTAAQILKICETVQDSKMPEMVIYVWGGKAARGRAAFIQSLIDEGKL